MYEWIVIVGGLFAFFAAMGIGANDAANSFATSVGSKALTIKQAVFLAAIFETSGAILMGSRVSETIRKGIADHKCFEDNPEALMYGCMWVVLSVGAWLFLASYAEMPVSTTHSCVGGMIGMAWALGGYDCIIWYEPLDTFPYVGGVGGIALSWVVSPLFSALIAGTLYGTLRRWILRRNFEAAGLNIAYPTIIGLTITLNIFFVIYKGAKGLGLDKIPIGIALGAAFGGGTVVAIIVVPFVPRIKRYVVKKLEDAGPEVELPNIEADIESKRDSLNIKDDRELNRIVRLHSEAERFDPRTEEVFKYLQIFTAMCASFSHGANDVANAIGPFAAIYTIWQVGDVQKNSVMDANAYWILSIGGVGITVGLFTYGYRIMHAMGDKLCKISPARGVAIELTSALVVITGSRLKIPLSTTHCQIGATVGVGALEDCRRCGGINCKIFMRTVAGWILTLIFVGGTTGLLVAQGMYSPPLQKCILTNVTG